MKSIWSPKMVNESINRHEYVLSNFRLSFFMVDHKYKRILSQFGGGILVIASITSHIKDDFASKFN